MTWSVPLQLVSANSLLSLLRRQPVVVGTISAQTKRLLTKRVHNLNTEISKLIRRSITLHLKWSPDSWSHGLTAEPSSLICLILLIAYSSINVGDFPISTFDSGFSGFYVYLRRTHTYAFISFRCNILVLHPTKHQWKNNAWNQDYCKTSLKVIEEQYLEISYLVWSRSSCEGLLLFSVLMKYK